MVGAPFVARQVASIKSLRESYANAGEHFDKHKADQPIICHWQEMASFTGPMNI